MVRLHLLQGKAIGKVIVQTSSPKGCLHESVLEIEKQLSVSPTNQAVRNLE